MRITCEYCNETVHVSDSRQISYITRKASDAVPAVHLISETSLGGTWLVHRCLVSTEPPA